MTTNLYMKIKDIIIDKKKIYQQVVGMEGIYGVIMMSAVSHILMKEEKVQNFICIMHSR